MAAQGRPLPELRGVMKFIIATLVGASFFPAAAADRPRIAQTRSSAGG